MKVKLVHLIMMLLELTWNTVQQLSIAAAVLGFRLFILEMVGINEPVDTSGFR